VSRPGERAVWTKCAGRQSALGGHPIAVSSLMRAVVRRKGALCRGSAPMVGQLGKVENCQVESLPRWPWDEATLIDERVFAGAVDGGPGALSSRRDTRRAADFKRKHDLALEMITHARQQDRFAWAALMVSMAAIRRFYGRSTTRARSSWATFTKTNASTWTILDRSCPSGDAARRPRPAARHKRPPCG